MIAYKISFLKQDRSVRDMLYAKLQDIAELYPKFYDKFTSGTGSPKSLKPGSEMVFDLENMNFRIINHLTAIEGPTSIEVDGDTVFAMLDEAA